MFLQEGRAGVLQLAQQRPPERKGPTHVEKCPLRGRNASGIEKKAPLMKMFILLFLEGGGEGEGASAQV